MKQDPRQHRKMWVGVGLSLLAVLGIWALQLKQTVWSSGAQNIGEGVRGEWEAAREKFDAVFEERAPAAAAAPREIPASPSEKFDPDAVQQLGENLKTESQ